MWVIKNVTNKIVRYNIHNLQFCVTKNIAKKLKKLNWNLILDRVN